MSDAGEISADGLRIYGVPTSITPRIEEAERLELFIDVGEGAADHVHALRQAIERVFTDPEAAAAFNADARKYLAGAGVSESLVGVYESLEVRLAQALGDHELQGLAEKGDVEGFVSRMQDLGFIPPCLDVTLAQAEAMGFTPWAVSVAYVAIIGILFVHAIVHHAVTVAAHVVVALDVAVWLLAAVRTLAAVWTAVVVWAEIWVGGPGGDNPDESADLSTPIHRLNLNSAHVMRLLNKTLHADLLAQLATYLHDKQFAVEVSGELIRRALLAVWTKISTGEVPEPERDQLYMDIVQTLATPEVILAAPELASIARYSMLGAGFTGSAFELMVRMREPVQFVGIGFNPRELLKYQRVLIIPTGALYGLDVSGTFKARLEEYVRLGGTVICMAQQHGYDFAVLPGGIEGYGWAEDQSCHAASVVITAPHPVFAGQDSDVMDVSIDGFFTAWPENAQVLLRRRVNGQPALLAYEYEQGRVVVTTAYADWGVGSNQLTRDERLLMRDLFAWARLADREAPEFDPDQLPFRLSFNVTNRSTRGAARILLNAVDPDKGVHEARYELNVPVGAGETREVTLEASDMTALGYWTLDAVLKDVNDQTVDVQYDVATLLVNNFDDTIDGVGYKSEPVSFSAVVEDEHLLTGATARVRLLFWNHSQQPRALKVVTNLNHRSPSTVNVQAPPGRRSEMPLQFGPLRRGNYRFWAYVYDERGRSLGSTTKGFFAYDPKAQVKISTDKNTYRPGEPVVMRLVYGSGIGAPFPADLLVAITDPSGTTIFDQRFSETLRPLIPNEREFRFNLPMTVRYGAFKVRVRADLDGRRVVYHLLLFTPVLLVTIAGRVL